MEPYQLWLIIGSSVTLITSGLGWLLSLVRANERRIRDLEIQVAVQKAIIDERKRSA